jgi:hypothetical protein
MKSALVFAAALVTLSAATALATSVLRLPFDEMARTSDLVLRGKVQKAESRWSGDGRKIFTDVEVLVEETLKGRPPRVVTVRQLGGTVGDLAQKVSGLHDYDVGEEVVLFLQKTPGDLYRVAGFAQGRYRVERSADGKAHAVPDEAVRGARLVDPGTRGEVAPDMSPVPLEEIRRRVRAAQGDDSTPAPAPPGKVTP